MNRLIIAAAASVGLLVGSVSFALLSPRSTNGDKRMDLALGREFVVDGIEYVSARKYPSLADHIVCVGEGGKEIILHVAAIENIIQARQNARDIIKEISK